MTHTHKFFSVHAVALGLLIVAAPGAASASVNWTFDTTNCVATVGPSGNCGSGDSNFSDVRTYQASAGSGGGNVLVSGWANTISSNQQLELGQTTHYDSAGLGVRNADGPRGTDDNEGSFPETGIDNDQRFDLVLFDFGSELVELSEVTLGSFLNDSDISVLAYTGNLDPTDSSGADYIGDREAWWNSTIDNNEDLTSHGWSVIGNHDVVNGGSLPAVQDINPGDVASSYWLVSAYNPVFGGDCTPVGSSCEINNLDYFNILALTGVQVPEPATIPLLLAAALPVAGGMRRRSRCARLRR